MKPRPGIRQDGEKVIHKESSMRIAHVVFLLACLTALPAFAADVPERDGFVTDASSVLAPPAHAALEERLAAYERQTSIEIAVLVVPTLDDEEIASFGDRVWAAWHIGKKEDDNGVLLLVVPPPTRRIRIQTGYGTEGWLTDLQSRRIIEEMRPLAQQGRHSEAIDVAVTSIMAALKESPWVTKAKAVAVPATPKASESSFFATFLLIVFGCFAVSFLFMIGHASRKAKRSSYRGSSGGSSRSNSSSSDGGYVGCGTSGSSCGSSSDSGGHGGGGDSGGGGASCGSSCGGGGCGGD